MTARHPPVIGLPGRDPATFEWMRRLLGALDRPEAEVLRYGHWDDHSEPRPDREASRLARHTPHLVVGKSLGTLVAVLAHADHGFRPRAAILLGTPLRGLSADQWRRYDAFRAAVPTLFVQQVDDITGTAVELAGRLGTGSWECLLEIPGSDHVYGDIDGYAGALSAWLANRT